VNIGGAGVTSTDETQGSMPLQYSLSQAYPNPFNPSTHIRYTLPYKSHVHLSILNTLGQQVAVLVDSEVEAGVHEVLLNGSKLASGVYFCRVEANSWFETKRLILMR